MTKLLLLLACCCLPFQEVIAQKDAPVAGHAANLVDLLKKDYNAVDPEMRSDEIIKDRALVISIFKGYLTEPQRASLTKDDEDLVYHSELVGTAFLNFNVARKAAAGVGATIATSQINESSIAAISRNSDELARSVENKKNEHTRKKCELDIAELVLISYQYKSGKNEYLAHLISLFVRKYEQLKVGTDSFSSSNYTAAVTKSIPFIGGELAFEMVADGLSRFLAKRIKEELTNQVIQQVSDWLKEGGDKDPLAEFKVMLPRTTQYLIGFQAEKVASFPDEIKQYIDDDLNHALENAANLKDTPRIRQLIEANPDLDFAMEAIEMIPNLSKLKNPADYFKTIENSRNLRRWKRDGHLPARFNIANLIQLSCMIGQSIVFIDNGELRFAGKDFMGTYVGEKNFFLLYMGFLYQQNAKYYEIEFRYKDGSGRKNMVLADELKKIVSKEVDTELPAERRFFNFMLTGIGENAEKVLASATDIRKANKSGKKVGADSVFRFVDNMINLSENVISASGALIDYLEVGNAEHLPRIRQTRGSLDQIAAPYFIVARTFNEIAFDIQTSKYANALIKVIELKDKLADQAVVSDADILSRANQLDYIHMYPTVPAWSKVITYLESPRTDFPLVTENCQVVMSDLEFIQKLGAEIHANNPAVSTFNSLFTDVRNLTLSDFESRHENTKQLKLLLRNPAFLKVAVAYYTGIFCDKIISVEEIEAKRKRFPIRGATISDQFDKDQIKIIKDAANAHILNFSEYLINGEDTDQMLVSQANLEKVLKQYLLSFDNDAATEKPTKRAIALIHFVNDMAVAKSTEDMEKAIEAFALPTGSYAIKRKSIFNFSVNSYPGILPAVERPWKTTNDEDPEFPGGSFSLGFTAPVGFSGTWSRDGFSYGLFFPVIDIGAITRLRLDKDKNTTMLPKLTFENFLAPGIYLHLGLRNTPLSLNLGAQIGPQIRKFNAEGEFDTFDSIRFGLGLVLDIPLVNLYTKPRFDEK